MTSSLITLILAVIAVIGFFFTVADRIRARRTRAEEKEASEIKKAVDDAVAKQLEIDNDKLRGAEASASALVQQLAERTDELRQARRESDFYRSQLFARLGGQVPEPPPATETP